MGNTVLDSTRLDHKRTRDKSIIVEFNLHGCGELIKKLRRTLLPCDTCVVNSGSDPG